MESVESGYRSVSTAAGVGIYARGDPEKGMRPGSGKREALVFPEALSKDAQLAPGVRAERFGRCRVSHGYLTEGDERRRRAEFGRCRVSHGYLTNAIANI